MDVIGTQPLTAVSEVQPLDKPRHLWSCDPRWRKELSNDRVVLFSFFDVSNAGSLAADKLI